MTQEKFIGWLEGYLDASGDHLDKDDIKIIKGKMKEIYISYTFTYPNPNIATITDPPHSPTINPYIGGDAGITQTYPSNTLNYNNTVTTKKDPSTKTILKD